MIRPGSEGRLFWQEHGDRFSPFPDCVTKGRRFIIIAYRPRTTSYPPSCLSFALGLYCAVTSASLGHANLHNELGLVERKARKAIGDLHASPTARRRILSRNAGKPGIRRSREVHRIRYLDEEQGGVEGAHDDADGGQQPPPPLAAMVCVESDVY